MKGKAKIIICICSFLLAIVALATSSFAWIVSVKRSGNIVFITGRVKYVLTGELYNYNTIVPNKELVNSSKKFTITNDSSIDTELRMQISYQFSDTTEAVEENWVVFTDQNLISNPLNTTMKVIGTISSSTTYEWVFKDGLWYFNNVVDGATTNGTITPEQKMGISVLESIYANGSACGNEECSTKNLLIKLDFQAKQKNYVNWETLGNIIKVA